MIMQQNNFDEFFLTSKVGFAGDWHGNTGWALSAVNILHAENIKVIYHLGDFGVWGGENGSSYLKKINNRLIKNNQLLIVTPGNHENYDMIDVWPTNEYGFIQRKDLERIWMAPRGFLWEHNGVRVGSMGGAGSIDRESRTIGLSWWPQEAITDDDVKTLEYNMLEKGWDSVEVLIVHEAPVESLSTIDKWPVPIHLELYAKESQIRVSRCVDIAKPRWTIHGHWHVARILDIGSTTVIGLDMDGRYANLATCIMDNGVMSDFTIMRKLTMEPKTKSKER